MSVTENDSFLQHFCENKQCTDKGAAVRRHLLRRQVGSRCRECLKIPLRSFS